jgi:hypothetical protein
MTVDDGINPFKRWHRDPEKPGDKEQNYENKDQ